ncbi:hypothetical protein N7527_011023 [Penicillium freii]|nr:hypothetical protein N7527_011023 [Penicillium freii]
MTISETETETEHQVLLIKTNHNSKPETTGVAVASRAPYPSQPTSPQALVSPFPETRLKAEKGEGLDPLA